MKKSVSVLIFCLVALSGNKVIAQGMRLGLQGGTSVNWFKSETVGYESEGVTMGFSYGLNWEFVMAENYTFATGLNIVYFGGKLSYPIASEITVATPYMFEERKYNLQNLEIPFTLKMRTREIGYNSYFAKFGFAGSTNLNAKADIRQYNPGPGTSLLIEDKKIKADIPLFRASMIIGIGVEHSLGGSTALVAGLNFNNGFTNMLRGKDYTNLRNQKARANYVELTVGVIF